MVSLVRFMRSALLLVLLLIVGMGIRADEVGQQPSAPRSWKDEYTVGPGDSFRLELYGKQDTIRSPVVIQPDGTISYLQVSNLKVQGMSLEQVRQEVQTAVEKYFRNVEVMIQPLTLRSKKYYLLGRVAGRGAYVMDHPMTIAEAVARAKGIETGVLEPTAAGLADLSHAFIVRNGKRLNVDFQKLFLEGDLSQNAEIEPDDYLYFPSAANHEVYVTGFVTTPSRVALVPDMTVMSALAACGSFNPAAFRDRVLVIRGSINNPETFVIDCNEILKGRATDMALQPRDIVYVSSRPWRIAEELLDAATSSFVQTAVNAWVGGNITLGSDEHPVIPQIR